MRRILVIAGDYSQFAQWCRENGFRPYQYPVVYVRSWHSLLGIHAADVVYTGTYLDLPDLHEIQRHLATMNTRPWVPARQKDKGHMDPGPTHKTLLGRQLAWDMFPHDSIIETFRKIGMTPGSADVLLMEHADSDDRVLLVSPLCKEIDPLAEAAADILTKAVVAGGGGAIPEHIVQAVADTYSSVVKSSVRAIIGQLLDRGVLTRKV